MMRTYEIYVEIKTQDSPYTEVTMKVTAGTINEALLKAGLRLLADDRDGISRITGVLEVDD